MLNTTYTEDITTGASITLLCLASAKFSDKKKLSWMCPIK